MMQEPAYRQLVDETFKSVDAAFEHVDPDLAESVVSQGTLTILYNGKLRFILSPQAPVRQLWAAFRDRAWHFDYDETARRWMDDRGAGIELCALVERVTKETVGETISVAAS